MDMVILDGGAVAVITVIALEGADSHHLNETESTVFVGGIELRPLRGYQPLLQRAPGPRIQDPPLQPTKRKDRQSPEIFEMLRRERARFVL
jgi:hypothetical protein